MKLENFGLSISSFTLAVGALDCVDVALTAFVAIPSGLLMWYKFYQKIKEGEK